MKTNEEIKLYISADKIDKLYEELCQLNSDRVYVQFGDDVETMTFNEFKNAKEFYENISKEIKQYNFTPLEAYLFAFIKTKTFKNYNYFNGNQDDDHKHNLMSRNPFIIINNDSIVCAGYTNFILEILKKLNFSASYLEVHPPEVADYHARLLIHLNDPYYNVDGVYIGEVTGGDNAVNEKPSCLDAVLTKSKKSYQEYQQEHFSSRKEFLYSISQLDIDDKYKSDENPEFYDIINRPIHPETMIKAVINMLKKTKPQLNEEEIIKESKDFYKDIFEYILSHSSTHYLSKMNLNEVIIDKKYTHHGMNIKVYQTIDFNQFIDYNHLQFKTNSWGWQIRNFVYGISITDKTKSNEETMDILLTNRNLFENEYIKLHYNDYYNTPELILSIPDDYTVEMLKEVFVEAANTINNILTKTRDQIDNQNHSR